MTDFVIKMSGYIYNSNCKTALPSTALSGIVSQKVESHNSKLHLIQQDATLSPTPVLCSDCESPFKVLWDST